MGCDAQLALGGISHWGNVLQNYLGKVQGVCFGEFLQEQNAGRNCLGSVQAYKSLSVVVMICATLVNTRTCTHTTALTAYTISLASGAKIHHFYISQLIHYKDL